MLESYILILMVFSSGSAPGGVIAVYALRRILVAEFKILWLEMAGISRNCLLQDGFFMMRPDFG